MTEDMILAHARSDYEFDGRGDWSRSARHDRERYCDRVRKGYTAALAGRVVMPKEPTEAMIDAVRNNGFEGPDWDIRSDYEVMIAAAVEDGTP